MNAVEQFKAEVCDNVARMGQDTELKKLSTRWIHDTARYKYSYNFSWLGVPIIQFPQDMFAMQELIWSIQPDLIIETGIAHGGSLIFYASMLELLGGDRQVLGIDVEIRPHNRAALEHHPLFKRITMLEGSSTDTDIMNQVREVTRNRKCVLVTLDSCHTHEHVLRELQLYSPFVTKGSYLVVFDTIVDDMPAELFNDRPWGVGNNPKTAVRVFLESNDRFVVDEAIENKVLITVAPSGFLRCIED